MLIADLLIGKKGMVNSGNLGDFLGALSQFIWSNISIDQASRILPALLSMNREDITVTTFPSYIKNYGKASAIGYDEATKNAFFRNISMQ
jgi:hypothetical protein